MGIEQIVNLIGQVVIMLAFGIGVLIVIKNLRGKIGVLESQLKSQSDILSKIKDFMSIFDVKKVKGYVKLSEEKFELERDKAIRGAKNQIKEKAQKGEKHWLNEFLAVYDAMHKLIYAFPFHPAFENSLKEMKASISKQLILEDLKKQKKWFRDKGIRKEGWMSKLFAFNPWLTSGETKPEKN